jgi:galactokinase/mevalonate kinase-like predicted kinase
VIAQKFDQARVRSFHHHNLKLCARLTNQRADIRARLRRVTRADLIAQERGDDRFLLITTVIELLKPEFGFDLYVNSDFPLSSGLGGSTALVSAIIGCFNEFRRDPLDNYEIAELAFQAERVTLNMSGGWQDQYATVFGGLNYLEFTSDDNVVHPLRLADSVSNPRLDAIYAAAISAGALGGRLLGAGGGGHFLFFVNPPHRQQVESRLTELSVVTTPFELETRGLQSWRVKLYPEAPTDVDIN